MIQKKKKNPTFDAMIKLFIQKYNIPTKNDVPTKKDMDRLIAKLDRLEHLIVQATKSGQNRFVSDKSGARGRASRGKTPMTASDMVLDIIERSAEKGIGFADIRNKTGFGEKKLRNIIFRLNDTGKIQRKSRGVYMVSDSV